MSGRVSSAHPRSRGEHSVTAEPAAGATGSSPLARGTRIGGEPLMAANRLIPARAGNTGAVMRTAACLAAHPRSRGEHACND